MRKFLGNAGFIFFAAIIVWGLFPGDTKVLGNVAGFVPHPAGEVTERLYVTLIALLGSGTILWMILNVLFKMRAYDQWIGEGVDDKPSRFFPGTDPEPYLRWAIGWLMTFSMQWNAWAYLQGFTLDQYLAQARDYEQMGLGKAWVFTLGWNVMVFLTGGAVAQGPDFIKGIASVFGEAKNAIAKALGKGE